MCGIAGIISYDVPASSQRCRLLAMRRRLRHRGPDGEGEHIDGHAALAHTRLALVDRPGGVQPMHSPDGRYVLVYNGEVYNFPKLRQELEDQWCFTTRTDTEVVLAAFVAWGEACLERLNGMFAFFVWDRVEERGFGARDRLGIKPFVYQASAGTLAFASEAKALLGPTPRPAVEAIVEYLAAPAFSGVDSSMFEGVEALPAGHALAFSRQGLVVRPWWDYDLSADLDGDPEDLAQELRQALAAAVRSALVADVPVGLFLSGGLDSTLLAALARQAGRSAGDPLAFTIQFEEQEAYDYTRSLIVKSDDTPYARLAACELGLEQRTVAVARSGIVADLERLAAINDALPAWEQELAQFHLSRQASYHRKAVLVGDAADETHFGYPFLLDEEAIRSPGAIFRRFGSAPVRRDLAPDPIAGLDAKYRALAEAAGHSWETRRRRLLATTYLIVKRWLARLLHNGDIHAMAWSLEVRVPFGDLEVLELARRIDPALGFRHGVEKWLLRQAGRGVLPEAIRVRKKSALPKDQNVEAEYRSATVHLLDTEPGFVAAFLELEPLRALCHSRRALTEKERMLLFRVLALAFWARHYGVAPP